MDFRRYLIRQSGFVVLLGAWAVLSAVHVLPPRAFPPPWDVATRLQEDLARDVWIHVAATVQTALMGLVLGVVLGLLLALTLTVLPTARFFSRPYITFANALPRIALAPLFILWFGVGISSKVALGVSMISFVVLLAMLAAFLSTEKDLILSVRAMGGSRSEVWRRVIWPNALPQFLASFRISVSLAMLASVAGEMLLSNRGLGWLIRRRGQGLDIEGIFSVLVIVAALSVVANIAVRLVSERSLKWL